MHLLSEDWQGILFSNSNFETGDDKMLNGMINTMIAMVMAKMTIAAMLILTVSAMIFAKE